MYSRHVRRAPIWLGLIAAFGCAGPPPVPPTAVIDASPEEVCAGDAYSTRIVLSGARSAERLSLVPAPPGPGDPPLSYAWELDGDARHVIAGELDEDELTVVMAGERPLHVTLRVTTIDGGEAETLRTIGVVFPVVPTCDEGCPEGSSCVQRGGASLCLPEAECTSDADCGCLICDPDLMRCAPPAEAP